MKLRLQGYWLVLTLLLGCHLVWVITAIMPEQKKKDTENVELFEFNPGAPIELEPTELASFAKAFGFELQVVKPKAGPAEQSLAQMSPKLLAISSSGDESIALISVQTEGKSELLKMRLGDEQFGYRLTSVDAAKIELTSAERKLVLYLFKYMESPEPGGL